MNSPAQVSEGDHTSLAIARVRPERKLLSFGAKLRLKEAQMRVLAIPANAFVVNRLCRFVYRHLFGVTTAAMHTFGNTENGSCRNA